MKFLSYYLPGYERALVYMLQSTEYQAKPYLAWFWRTRDFRSVAKRRQLDRTKAARLLLLAIRLGIILQLALAVLLILNGNSSKNMALIIGGALMGLSYPFVWAHLIVLPMTVGRWLIVRPRQRKLIAQSRDIFANHPGVIIAVAGSYGKTSMKEILHTVLSEGKKVAATPANRNVTSSHAEFAAKLEGDEDVLIIEYGEGEPGDVARFCDITRPNIGIVTGLAPAHLDQYKSLDAAGNDIFSLAEYLNHKDVYVNGESEAAKPFIKPDHNIYSLTGISDWQVHNIAVDFTGTQFTVAKPGTEIMLKSGLLGKHQVGPLVAAAKLADKLGLSQEQIIEGIAKTRPFEHRMQPYPLHGAWIIDDSYNGNIDGIRAGLRLLKELPAKKKIYVAPGLVDQGAETKNVHVEMGRLIAEAQPDQAILMQNSVTPYIQKGLDGNGYTGEVIIEQDPLSFYTNLDQFVAAGDLIMMQNDWTDNYA